MEPDDPNLLRIHGTRLIKRDIDQLLGICEFALQDGMIDQAEAENILTWLNAHKGCLDTWPANILYDRLRTMFADGILDDQEQGDLLGLILQIAQPKNIDWPTTPSSLPLDDPAPPITINGNTFCFTGVFDFGSRAQCQAAVSDRGGVPIAGITKKLRYLVIGNVGAEVWLHSSFGTKIAKAVEYRDQGVPIIIVSENHWVKHINHL